MIVAILGCKTVWEWNDLSNTAPAFRAYVNFRSTGPLDALAPYLVSIIAIPVVIYMNSFMKNCHFNRLGANQGSMIPR